MTPKIRSAFSEDPDVMRALDSRETKDLLSQLVESNKNPGMDQFAQALRGVFKGDTGTSPEKGKDYFTPEEIDQFKKDITPQKFKDYFTEDELDKIMQALLETVAQHVEGVKEEITPKKGVDYRDGKDGRDGIDGTDGTPGVDGKPGKDGRTPKVQEVLDAIVALSGDDATNFGKVMGSRIDISQIRNAQSFMMKGSKSKYKVEELMHGGGSSGNSTSNILTQYNLTATQVGSDAVVQLSQLSHFATLVGVVVAYRNQIPQTPGTTCTITATTITFLNADAGEIFAATYTYS